MTIFKRLLAKILNATANLVDIVFNGLIMLVESMVVYISRFLKGCLALVSMGGCLFFLLFFNFAVQLLFHPVALPVILFLFTFLLLGGKLASHLKYVRYITTEYLNHTAKHLVEASNKYRSFNEFKADYRRAEEERIRAEQQRYYQRQREWEEQFWQSFNQQNYQGGGGSYGYGNYGGQSSYGQGFGNPTADFKYKYEKSCDTLGVAYNADKQEIKAAYRKKAKEYHPDLSKLPDATKIFQEITAAYEFLSDENRQRYSSL